MSTYTQITYHLVFSTKERRPTLDKPYLEKLYHYLWGYMKNKQCHLLRIGGTVDHVHILFELHPSNALADFVKDMKVASSYWLKSEGIFPAFEGWQRGYGAFTHANGEREVLIQYIKNQEAHHRQESFQEEFIRLLDESGIQYDPQYLH